MEQKNQFEDRSRGKRFARNAKKALKLMVDGMNNEVGETQEMASLFFRLLGQKLKLDDRSDPPSKEEVREAIEQLKDVGRISIFASISILPGGQVSLIGLELLARKFGIRNFTIVPSSFRKKHTSELQKDQKTGSSNVQKDESTK
jgi:hypothetical protein